MSGAAPNAFAIDAPAADAPVQPGAHATEAARVRLGSDASTPAHVLTGLACDPAVTVRAAVAMNPACPPSLDGAISQDADERVRTLLARKLAGGEGAKGGALAALAADPALRVRAAVADGLKAAPDAPRGLILQLAQDAAPTVCDPVIRLSPLLTDADLLALLAAPPHPAAAIAVASRPGLGAALADAVAAGGDGVAIRALLCGSAAIAEATLDALAEQAAPHPDWHGPLVRHPLLTPRAMEALAGFVAAPLLDVLAQRADLDPAVARALRRRMAAVSPDAAPDDGEEAQMAALRQLDEAGRLNEATLIDAARAGDLRRVAAVLAVAGGLTLAAVDRAAAQRHARALIGLAWKAGFSMRAALVAQVALGRLGPGALILAGPDGAFPLTPDEMQWHLEVLAQSAG